MGKERKGNRRTKVGLLNRQEVVLLQTSEVPVERDTLVHAEEREEFDGERCVNNNNKEQTTTHLIFRVVPRLRRAERGAQLPSRILNVLDTKFVMKFHWTSIRRVGAASWNEENKGRGVFRLVLQENCASRKSNCL